MCDHSAGHLPDNRFPVRKGDGNQDQGNQREFQGFRTKLHKPPEKKESCGGRAASPTRTDIYAAGVTHSLRGKFNNSPLRGKEQR